MTQLYQTLEFNKNKINKRDITNGCCGYPNSTLNLYGKWRDLEFEFCTTSAVYFNKYGWRGRL